MAESEIEFVERIFSAASPASRGDPEWCRIFALARRGAGLTLDRQRHIVREDHSQWIRETYSRYLPYTPPPEDKP